MSAHYTLYAWEASLYSGKLRAYLRHKGLPFREKTVRIWDMARIQRRVRARVMPVLVTPTGQWLQDTGDIIAALEARHPQPAVLPVGPAQRLAAAWLEAWGDEFWLPAAMHYRWRFAENLETLIRPEFGANLLPPAPRFLQRRLADGVMNSLRGFLPGLGVTPEQGPLIERWSESLCDALDQHFAEHPYLLGGRPCLGDFGLIGPLYAHLGRDPYPARELVGRRPHLAAWVQRMQRPPQPQGGDFLADDAVPESLRAVFASVFGEFLPQVLASRDAVRAAEPARPSGRGYSRLLGEIEIPMAGEPFRLRARPFVLWKAQRAQAVLEAMHEADRAQALAWANDVGGGALADLDLAPVLQRRALYVLPASD